MPPGSPSRIGPYQILEELGRGGMGVVYRARHPQLGRDVALKVIAPGSGAGPEAVTRMRREAQAAARLAGAPGIVGVHDLGEADGHVWFAMELVDGRGLDALIADGELAPRDAAALLAKVARAVQRAHDAGVLHRDLKPGNVLVDAQGEPHVSDFGLAKLTAASAEITKLTRSGELLGTPAYMSPEQARGEPCDARADVYALGATLHEAVGGLPPFRADSVHGVLARVLNEPPPPLRQVAQGVPVALEAITLRCLAKRREARYPSAAALAGDLERFLRGERVHARLPGAWARGRGVLARHRVAALGAASVLTLAAAAVGALTWWRARGEAGRAAAAGAAAGGDRSELARQLAQAYATLVVRGGPAMQRLERASHGAPLAPPERAAVLAELAAAADAARAACPAAALPAAWDALVRVRAGQADDGLQRLRAAAEVAGDDPFPRVLVAWAALDRYVGALKPPAATLTTTGVELHPYAETPAMRDALAEARAALAGIDAVPVWSDLTQGREVLDFVRGADAFAAGRYAEATAALRDATDAPLFADGARALRGLAQFQTGAFAQAAGDWEALAAAGWTTVDAFVATAWIAAGLAGVAAGSDPEPAYHRAIGAYGAAVRRRPDAAVLWCNRGHAHLLLARARDRADADPRPTLGAAVADYRAALERAPNDLAAWNALGTALWTRAEAARRRGADAGPDFAAATDACDRAATVGPTDLEANRKRGFAWFLRAEWLRDAGHDASAAWQHAIGAFDQALGIAPDDPESLDHRARCRLQLADLARLAGIDVRPQLEAALADVERWRQRRPDAPDWRLRLAEVRCGLGEATPGPEALAEFRAALAALDALGPPHRESGPVQFLRGKLHVRGAPAAERAKEDVAAWIDVGVDALRAAVRVAPANHEAHEQLGQSMVLRAKLARARGEDPAPHVAAALAAFDAALAARREVWILSNRAGFRLEVAAWAAAEGGDGEPWGSDAIADFREAAAAQPTRWGLHHNLGVALRDRALRRRARTLDPGPDADAAAAAFAAAIAADPGPWRPWFERGVLRVTTGEWVQAAGKDAARWYRAGIEDLTAALARAAGHVDVRHNLANARRLLAATQGAAGRAELERAEAEFRAVVAEAPRAWQPLAGWAMALEGLDRLDEARAAWARVVALRPDLELARTRLAALGGR